MTGAAPDPAPLVGVDLGGTLIRAAVATGPASHGEPVRLPTPAAAPPEGVLDAVAAAVRKATHGLQPAGVGIGIPGPLDPAAGVVYAAPNMHGWHDVPVRQLLEERLGCPVATAGTAGEVGHIMVDIDGPVCGQGHKGCLEGSASGTAIAHRARALVAAGEPSTLASLPPAQLDARAVADAAEAGDALAVRIYHDAARALGLALGGLVNLLSPEVVVIGGGLINAGDLLLAPMHQAVGEIAFAAPLARCRIVPAALGTDAGLVGAVAWAVRLRGGDHGAAAPAV